MKYYISNRGNLTRVNAHRENTPDYIKEAIYKGFDCVVDVFVSEGVLYSVRSQQHMYILGDDFIAKHRRRLWLRCEDYETVNHILINYPGVKCFINSVSQVTSNGAIWTYHYNLESTDLSKTIMSMPEWNKWKTTDNALGVSSDYIQYIRNYYMGV